MISYEEKNGEWVNIHTDPIYIPLTERRGDSTFPHESEEIYEKQQRNFSLEYIHQPPNEQTAEIEKKGLNMLSIKKYINTALENK
jgi:hypothetical protein